MNSQAGKLLSITPDDLASARCLLQSAERVLVVSHVRPDGDAIGSLLGLGLALEAAGKQVQLVLADGVPATFRFLAGNDKIRTKIEVLPGGFDAVVVVDASELDRVGTVLEGMNQPHLNIDHHITNTLFAQVNLVESDAVATAELLALRLPELGLPVPLEAAEALLTGILTDTIGFRTTNMSARALRTAAMLVEAGANLPELYHHALLQRSFQAARFWGRGLSSLQREGRLVWTALTMQARAEAGYAGRDDADLVNILSSIRDVDIAVIFIEQPDEQVKVSWRSLNGSDVSQMAQQFGGGGHRAAAGATVPGPLAEAQARVLKITREMYYNGLPVLQGEQLPRSPRNFNKSNPYDVRD